ncbi:MAG: DJ-1/PfpI family protein [Acidimicrobiia bacterium]|nr:DJ-1/PfpI family protein [Acidimicrobiia bacterium]MDH3462056.1 DJ-1/PfpI family protein [Acidimicrobiia bacterium]
MTTFGLICFDGMEELDLVGPWEVLRMWQLQWPEDGVDVFTASLDGPVVTCAKGMQIVTDRPVSELGDVDVILFPGGIGTRRFLGDTKVGEWLRGLFGGGTLITSVCTGSLVLADAGLLSDRPATTYWSQLDFLQSLDPTIELHPDHRFVDSGEIITASGVSAGIDMALHLVKRFHSEERAREVRKAIQYDPEPPV